MRNLSLLSITYKIFEHGCYRMHEMHENAVKTRMYAEIARLDERQEIPQSMYRRFVVKKVNYRGFPVFIMQVRNRERRNKKAILFLAGGGGMSRPMGIHFDTAARLLQKTGATMYFAYYPLAPKHNAQQAVKWLKGVYQAMQKRYAAENIIFAGDSAGANLAFSLAYKAEKKPGKIIAISPAPAPGNGQEDMAVEKLDPLLNVETIDMIKANWAKDVPPKCPDVNPIYVEYENFPKVLMFYGTHEIFYPNVKKLVKKIREAGVELETVEKPMCHDWALCSFFPEGRAAVRKMVNFILE